MFHDHFLRASARTFFKPDGAGAFARAHKAVLDMYGWESLRQEILVSTPRRFGKTFSVSMFAAALLFSARGVELSIYSTCKRISQKLLRNVQFFLKKIHDQMGVPEMRVVRSNMEEVILQGPEADDDHRRVNSYPSKVRGGSWGERGARWGRTHPGMAGLRSRTAVGGARSALWPWRRGPSPGTRT